MLITYERAGRCLWHSDCDKNPWKSGVMREVKKEQGRTLLECLHCGKKAYYPHGSVGEVLRRSDDER